MRYAIFTIDTPNSNRGNRLIEYALKTTLELPEPSVSVSMFCIPTEEQITQINTCDFVLIPGSTTLALGKWQGDALVCLPKIKIPIFCTAASSWGPTFPINKEAVKYITEPIGVRDRITEKEVIKCGKKAILVGCPTAYMEKESPIKTAYDVCGFYRTKLDWQVNFFKNNSKKIISSIQEIGHELPSAKKLSSEYFTYDNPKLAYQMYSGANNVYTGRLHSILPAISQGKNVLFIGDKLDTRFDLLEYLGITINEIGTNFKTEFSKIDNNALNNLKDNYLQWKTLTVDFFR